MNRIRHRAVGAYLRDLDRALRGLPAARRDELVADIEDHISAALAEHPEPTDDDVRRVLDRLGDPRDIAREAGGPDAPATTTWFEVTALAALLLPLVGWLVGLPLIWASRAWRTGDKLVASLLAVGLVIGATVAAGSAGESVGVAELASLWVLVHLVPAGLLWRRRPRGDALDTVRSAPGSGPGTDVRRIVIALLVALLVVPLTLALLAGVALVGVEAESGQRVVTPAMAAEVDLGDTRDAVGVVLGGAGESTTVVPALDRITVRRATDPGRDEYGDCWSYPVVGDDDPGGRALVCFEADEVVLVATATP